jgi:hypothetical protein
VCVCVCVFVCVCVCETLLVQFRTDDIFYKNSHN